MLMKYIIYNRKKKNGSPHRLPFLLSLSTIFCIFIITSQSFATSSVINAWFRLVPAENTLRVIPTCRSRKKIHIRYEIIATKSGESGQSQTRQGGEMLLLPGKKQALSQLQYDLGKDNQYRFSMRIFAPNSPVTEISTQYPR